MSQNTNCGEPNCKKKSQQFATAEETAGNIEENTEKQLAKTIWGNLKKALKDNERTTLHGFCRENDLTYKTLCNQITQNRPPKLSTLIEIARNTRTSVSFLLDEADNWLEPEEMEIIRKYRTNSSFASCVDFIRSLTPEAIRNLSRFLANFSK